MMLNAAGVVLLRLHKLKEFSRVAPLTSYPSPRGPGDPKLSIYNDFSNGDWPRFADSQVNVVYNFMSRQKDLAQG